MTTHKHSDALHDAMTSAEKVRASWNRAPQHDRSGAEAFVHPDPDVDLVVLLMPGAFAPMRITLRSQLVPPVVVSPPEAAPPFRNNDHESDGA